MASGYGRVFWYWRVRKEWLLVRPTYMHRWTVLILSGWKQEGEDEEEGAGERFNNEEHLLLSLEDRNVDPSTHVRYLTNTCDTSSRGPNGLFWSSWVPANVCLYTQRHINKIINLQNRRITKLWWVPIVAWLGQSERGVVMISIYLCTYMKLSKNK